MTPSFAHCALSRGTPAEVRALPVAAAARTFVTYCSSGITSILICTPLSLWASLKLSIIFCQTSPSEAEPAPVIDHDRIGGLTNGAGNSVAAAPSSAVRPAARVNCRRVKSCIFAICVASLLSSPVRAGAS